MENKRPRWEWFITCLPEELALQAMTCTISKDISIDGFPEASLDDIVSKERSLDTAFTWCYYNTKETSMKSYRYWFRIHTKYFKNER